MMKEKEIIISRGFETVFRPEHSVSHTHAHTHTSPVCDFAGVGQTHTVGNSSHPAELVLRLV